MPGKIRSRRANKQRWYTSNPLYYFGYLAVRGLYNIVMAPVRIIAKVIDLVALAIFGLYNIIVKPFKMVAKALFAPKSVSAAELLKQLASNKETQIFASNAEYKHRLHLAINQGKLEIAKQLIQNRSVDINLKDSENKTPLDHAVDRGYKDLVLELVRSGAKYDSESDLHQTVSKKFGEEFVQTLQKTLKMTDTFSPGDTPNNTLKSHEQKASSPA
ncbi:MAG: ankyrin repeat domain-containing protein [Rickettsiaceae bacterium]|nr:ankyrin repeat domain-containing protein [Rickettsiaceae bacterium]